MEFWLKAADLIQKSSRNASQVGFFCRRSFVLCREECRKTVWRWPPANGSRERNASFERGERLSNISEEPLQKSLSSSSSSGIEGLEGGRRRAKEIEILVWMVQGWTRKIERQMVRKKSGVLVRLIGAPCTIRKVTFGKPVFRGKSKNPFLFHPCNVRIFVLPCHSALVLERGNPRSREKWIKLGKRTWGKFLPEYDSLSFLGLCFFEKIYNFLLYGYILFISKRFQKT